MATEDDSDVPETGAIFTFGKSKFGDNSPCKFWLKNDQVSHVCCGDEHTALVTENGRTFMFGSNVWGQLGLGHTNTVTKPTRIKDKAIKDEKVKLIGCGRHHTVLATESGKLFSFGGNSDGQLGLGAEGSQPVTKPQYIESLSVRNFKMLSCGAEHSVALTEDGKLYVWGGGSEGQLGLAQTTEMAEPTLLPFDESIVYVACGYYHTAFVTESGKLYTFGEMDCGKLGQGDEPPDHQVAQVVHGIGGRVVAVACGGSHTVALTESGSVYTFGDGSNGQLGHGTTILVADTPQELSWGKNVKVKFASCGENSTSLITDKGQLYTFGDGRHGKLALGEENFANQFTPSLVLRFENFTVQKVSCGGCHMLAIAKIRTENGVKDDWEDSEGEDDMDASPSNNLETTLRKSADFSGGSLDLSGSIAARNRRREKLPDPMGTLNRTLPPLNSSLRGLPPLGQTQAPLDDTLSKKTLPQIHKLEEPESKSAKPVAREEQHKAAERKKKEDTEEEESSDVSVTEESSEEEEEKKPALIHKTTRETNKSVPLPKPRAMPRKSKEEEDKEEESSVESEDEGDDDEESEDNEEEERAERKKHLKQEEEKKEEAEKTKVKPKPALRKSKEQEKKSEDSDEEEETEEEEEDSEEDVSNKKLSKKQAVDEAKRKKQADKKEKEKPKKKPKPISVFGRRRVTQSEDDHNNDSSDDDDDDDEEEEEEEQKKSKGAKDKKDKKKTKKEKNKKSDEDSEDEEEEDDEEEDQKEAKKSKNKDKNKKGKKKTKENDSEEDEDGSEDEEADNKNEKKSESSKGVEDKQSKACTIL